MLLPPRFLRFCCPHGTVGCVIAFFPYSLFSPHSFLWPCFDPSLFLGGHGCPSLFLLFHPNAIPMPSIHAGWRHRFCPTWTVGGRLPHGPTDREGKRHRSTLRGRERERDRLCERVTEGPTVCVGEREREGPTVRGRGRGRERDRLCERGRGREGLVGRMRCLSQRGSPNPISTPWYVRITNHHTSTRNEALGREGEGDGRGGGRRRDTERCVDVETTDEDAKGKKKGGRRHHPPPVVLGLVPRANTIERNTRAWRITSWKTHVGKKRRKDVHEANDATKGWAEEERKKKRNGRNGHACTTWTWIDDGDRRDV